MRDIMNKFRLALIIVASLLLTVEVYSQHGFDTETICETEQTDILRVLCDTNYIPDQYTSIKYVKVNFHFMMKSDSTMNFNQFNDGNGNCSFNAYDYSEILINYSNVMLSQNKPMNLPYGNNTPVIQRRYRLKLMGVYFHFDDAAYTFYNSSLLSTKKSI